MEIVWDFDGGPRDFDAVYCRRGTIQWSDRRRHTDQPGG